MRDVILTAIVFGSLPAILWRPHVGVLMWTWLGFMNPHRLVWGFAYGLPFAHVVALVTLFALVLTREPKKMPWTGETRLLLIFAGWMVLTTFFAAYEALAWDQLEKVLKVLLMVFVTLMLLQSKARINQLVWVVTLSLAFFGVKGGIFTVVNGGEYHVWGPGGFIGGNNEIALALVMTIPLLRYLQMTATRAWLRHALTTALILTALAVVGSQSRGALVGLAAMGAFFWIKSRHRFFSGLVIGAAALLIVSTMPEQWFERMSTIKTYEEDRSAMGRINAWQMAFNMALERPLGGGFETFQEEMFARYAPNPADVHDAHSIYFEVLGEHGFVGLALFLALGLMTWRSCSWLIRRGRGDPEKQWAADLGSMVQVSLVGYAAAGAFLGLAYFDLYYILIALVVLSKTVLGAQAVSASAHAVRGAPLAPRPARAIRGDGARLLP